MPTPDPMTETPKPKPAPDVRQIVTAYLRLEGYDGLYADEDADPDGCACVLDDLMPCDGYGMMNCRPGMKHPHPDPSEGDFWVGPREGKAP